MQIKYGTDGEVIDIKGFLLPKVPIHPERCQMCGKELTEYERKIRVRYSGEKTESLWKLLLHITALTVYRR